MDDPIDSDSDRFNFNTSDLDVDNPEWIDPTAYNTTGEHATSRSHSTNQSSTSIGTKRVRRKTSECWDHFDEEIVVEDDVNVLKARCKRCGRLYSSGRKGGTGHLNRHTLMHQKKDAGRQTTVKFNPDDTVRNFTYDPNVHREAICRLIASNDLPLGFGESEGFIEYI